MDVNESSDKAESADLPLASAGMPICKATEELGPIKAVCRSGNYNLADDWANVTCRSCLRTSPGQETP